MVFIDDYEIVVSDMTGLVQVLVADPLVNLSSNLARCELMENKLYLKDEDNTMVFNDFTEPFKSKVIKSQSIVFLSVKKNGEIEKFNFRIQ
ncbi:MAG: hypothetical protein KZQ64_06270 [gamma proteobacterium symbiont of Bathyaustriella thionipta]|nr:hypothetical protein [gamma proteobacterium symbiont of Bathyaustriella thionipta]MCU7952977.1 hypothetical protein [gamma proteobacterium symbiont of Bathyaustriella thionipta]MCU7957923.1 hypothetical protein [gamma proteobacterium symbiont of Bathyaustriella thionipta]MCU7968573.1 hypothetical protein [gamma proteobacterium symbiont of Bathyaustriella thionipta]